jgi:hypothetical protein
MIVFVTSGVDGGAPGLLAGTGSTATPPLAQQSPAARTAPLPDLRAFPRAPAPGELTTVLLPDTEHAVSALIERLPPAVAGHLRSPQFDLQLPERIVVGYGEDRRIADVPNPLLRFLVIDLRKGDFFPTNWTGGQVVGVIAQAKAAMDAGRDGDLFWLRDETVESVPGSTDQVVIYGVTWGRIDSRWLFTVQGDTTESRDALLMAVVAAARSASADRSLTGCPKIRMTLRGSGAERQEKDPCDPIGEENPERPGLQGHHPWKGHTASDRAE